MIPRRLVSALCYEFYPFDGLDFSGYAVAEYVDDLQKDDVLILWGGGDIHPSLYNRGRSQWSHAGDGPSPMDVKEWNLVQKAIDLEIPIIGVCRGAQMLCAAAGGYLIQHLNNHAGKPHMVSTNDNHKFVVSSLHHQMMMPGNTNHEVIAWTTDPKAEGVYMDVDKMVKVDMEYEMILFKDINGIAVQWHPEIMAADSAGNCYLRSYIKEFLEEYAKQSTV